MALHYVTSSVYFFCLLFTNAPYYDYPLYLHELSEIIDKGLQSTNPAIRIKYLWMKEKYNSVVKDIQKNLDNWDGDIEVKDAYESLPIF